MHWWSSWSILLGGQLGASILLASPTSPSLQDLPMAGEAVFYLDGADWEAVGSGRQYNSNWTDPLQWPRTGGCTWEDGVDYTSGLSAATPLAYGMNKQTCCDLCAATEACAAAVYKNPAPSPAPPPPPPVIPSTDCKFMNETDFHPETGEISIVHSANSTECCARCRVTKGCAVAVQYSGQCYMKNVQSVGKAYPRPGRIACVPNADCEFITDIDFHPDTDIGSVKLDKSEGAGACCDICGKKEGCVVGVLFEGTCYLKAVKDMTSNYTRPGRTVCRPQKKAEEKAEEKDTRANGMGRNCFFKTAADVKKRIARKGVSACTPINPTKLAEIRIKATVPGDLVTDLQRAGEVGDPLLDTNFRSFGSPPYDAAKWNGQKWVFSKTFVFPNTSASAPDAGTATREVLLVLDGVKMGATIALDGTILGNTTNQHRRYQFPVGHLLSLSRADGQSSQSHTLSITFDWSIANGGRFMACSGGWDWAPYSRMRDIEGNPFFTRGVWKSLYLVSIPLNGAVISHMQASTTFAPSTPTWPLSALKDGDENVRFTVNTTVHLWTPPPASLAQTSSASTAATLRVAGSWKGQGSSVSVPISLPAAGGASVVSVGLVATGSDVLLWWPRGMGAQPLYNVSATVEFGSSSSSGGDGGGGGGGGGGGSISVTTSRRIGFRLAALVTGNDTNATFVQEALSGLITGNPKPTHTLMLRVNGAPVFAKGANVIPMEALEGRLTSGRYRQMVASAADGGMNTLRVWGESPRPQVKQLIN
jgi:hypothetical protein